MLVEVPVAANYWISPMLFQESIVKSKVPLFSERPHAHVVQLTGVPAIKKKATQTKSNTVSL